jgi:hypothetical protein
MYSALPYVDLQKCVYTVFLKFVSIQHILIFYFINLIGTY